MSETKTEALLTIELAEDAAEPLLPIEKKLIVWSLGIGVGLLAILGVLNRFLPVS